MKIRHLRSFLSSWLVVLAFFTQHNDAQAQVKYDVNVVDSGYNPRNLNMDNDIDFTGWNLLYKYEERLKDRAVLLSPYFELPFYFEFYGIPVTHFRVSAYGVLTFSKKTDNYKHKNHVDLPTNLIPDTSIIGFWGDTLDGSLRYNEGHVHWKMFGSYPRRQFYLSFKSYYYYYRYGGPLTYKIVLEEGTNQIEVIDCAHTDNPELTLGLQLNKITYQQVGDHTLTPKQVSSPDNYTYYTNNLFYQFTPKSKSDSDLACKKVIGIDSSQVGKVPFVVSCEVVNLSKAKLSAIPLAYQVNNSKIIRDTLYGKFGRFSAKTFTFKHHFRPHKLGRNRVKVWVELDNDGNAANDTAYHTIHVYDKVSSFPYRTSWETGDSSWNVASSYKTRYFQLTQTPRAVGPKPRDGKYYWTTDSIFNYPRNIDLRLISPVFDFSKIQYPTSSFWLYMDADTIGDGMIMERTLDSGKTWVKVKYITDSIYDRETISGKLKGMVWTGKYDKWRFIRIIDSLAGKQSFVSYRFRFVSDKTLSATGAYIDDYFISDLTNRDVGVTDILRIRQRNCSRNFDNPAVIIKNYGNKAQDTIPVTLTYSKGRGSLSDTLFAHLLPGQSDTLFFKGNLARQNTPDLRIRAYTTLKGDTNVHNDTAQLFFRMMLSTPDPPNLIGDERCGPGRVFLSGKSDAYTYLNWYADSSATTPLDTGDSKSFIVKKTSTYYVSANSWHTTRMGLKDTSGRPVDFVEADYSWGHHIYATDSFYIGDVTIYSDNNYYIDVILSEIVGSYNILNTKHFKLSSAKGIYTINLDFLLEKGKYYFLESDGDYRGKLWRNEYHDGFPIKTPEFGAIRQNSILYRHYVFYNMEVYKKGCESKRVPVEGIVIPALDQIAINVVKPSGLKTASTNFYQPDSICSGDSIIYDITPPPGFTNASYGKDWMIDSIFVLDSKGIPVVDTYFVAPNALGNGKMIIVPGAINERKTVKFSFKSHVPGEKCNTQYSVYFYPKPTPQLNFTVSKSCLGTATTITDQSSISAGSFNYLWEFGDGQSYTKNTGISHTFDSIGANTISLKSVSNLGCIARLSKVIWVNDRPVAKFSTGPACIGIALKINNESYCKDSISSYSWNFGDGNSSILKEPTPIYDTTGNFIMELQVTSDSGCVNSITKTITVNTTPTAAFTYSNLCVSDSVKLKNKTTSIANIKNYNWSFGDGLYSVNKEPWHQFAKPGYYTINLNATTIDGCSDSVNHTIEVFEEPVVDFRIIDACLGDSTYFINQTTIAKGAITNYLWKLGTTEKQETKDAKYYFDKVGLRTITLQATSDNGCENTKTMDFTVYSKPVVNFQIQKTGNDLYSYVPSNKGLASYHWDFGDGNVSSDVAPTHHYAESGNYLVLLTAKSIDSCSNISSENIEVKNGINSPSLSRWEAYPNPFINECKLTYSLHDKARVILEVYDFNGRLIERMVNGNQLPGDYYYVFNTANTPGSFMVRLIVDDAWQIKEIVKLE